MVPQTLNSHDDATDTQTSVKGIPGGQPVQKDQSTVIPQPQNK
jgi:hypothetical protein